MAEFPSEQVHQALMAFSRYLRSHPEQDKEQRYHGAMEAALLEAHKYELEHAPEPDFWLAPRSYQVLELLAQGNTYKQIALELHLSVSTVRTHICHVYRVLGTVDRAQAALLFKQGKVGCANPEKLPNAA